MHKKSFYLINKFDKSTINNLDKNIHIIYRNYNNKFNIDDIVKLKKICKLKNRKLFLANNLKLAISHNLDGAYIPSFNKTPIPTNFNKKIFTSRFCTQFKRDSRKRRQKIDIYLFLIIQSKKRNYF